MKPRPDRRTTTSFGFYWLYALGGLFLVAVGIARDSVAAIIVGTVMAGVCLLAPFLAKRHPRWHWFA